MHSVTSSSTGLTSLLDQSKSLKSNSSKYIKGGIYAGFKYGKYKFSLVENQSGRITKTWYSTVKVLTNIYKTVAYRQKFN